MCSSKCSHYYTIFTPEKLVLTSSERQAKWYNSLSKLDQRKVYGKRFNKSTFKTQKSKENKLAYQASKNTIFPPRLPSKKLIHKIISEFCDNTHPSKLLEAGCAVCGQLKKITDMLEWCNVSCSFELLIQEGVRKIERKSEHEEIKEFVGPVIDEDCEHICKECYKFLKKGKTPDNNALCNGFWVGKIPEELACLTYVEQLLISRVRHNRCIIKVASGRYKMHANAITFHNPIAKIYDTLPSVDELDEVLAVMFTGPCQPTKTLQSPILGYL